MTMVTGSFVMNDNGNRFVCHKREAHMAEKDGRRTGILGDFSLSQIVATGLAAATSFALSAQIGIAGSIIGAVIGAVASSVATQVYRNLLNASAEKLR